MIFSSAEPFIPLSDYCATPYSLSVSCKLFIYFVDAPGYRVAIYANVIELRFTVIIVISIISGFSLKNVAAHKY